MMSSVFLEESGVCSPSKEQITLNSLESTPTLTKPSLMSPQNLFDTNVYEIAARLMFASVSWLKDIQSLSRLELRDQLSLVEQTWCPLFVLSAAQINLPIKPGK